MFYSAGQTAPQLEGTAYIADGARIIGGVHLGAEANIWYNAVLRADNAPILVGPRTNLQDGCIVHTDCGQPCRVGAGVTVGHGAILHACTVETIVGAGALVTKNTIVPPGSLILGSPAKVKRALTEEEIEHNRASAAEYCRAAKEQLPAVCR